MSACKDSPHEAEKLLEENGISELSVACKNSHNECVIAGPTEQLTKLENICKDLGTNAKRLDVPYGIHSNAMDPILRQLEDLGQSVTWR